MADKFQKEVTAMLHKYNIFTRHEKPIVVRNGNTIVGWSVPERNTPDLSGGLVHHINVEVKTGGKSFPFNRITDGQYRYAEEWREKRGCEYWFAIMFSLDNPVWGRLKRDLFLVPFPELQYAKEVLSGVQDTIPYEYEKGMRRAILEKGATAVDLWGELNCSYSPKEKWSIPPHHPFAHMYFNQPRKLYSRF